MKTKKRRTVIVSALFAVLCLAQTASAFYAPNLQRWVNRDPKHEDGGINLYEFAVNRPIDKFDPLGLAVPVCVCWVKVYCIRTMTTQTSLRCITIGSSTFCYESGTAFYDCWNQGSCGDCSNVSMPTSWTEKHSYGTLDRNGTPILGEPAPDFTENRCMRYRLENPI